jgi:SAM-dependent methyltransferase
MPTLPPDQAKPHEQRQMAESFGIDAARYDRARPRYPDALVQRIVAASPGPDFLDVGCGTGIAARQFQAAGRTVSGVEPDARMADFARGRGLDVEVSTFETWDAAGRTFDAVVAGQTWHWVDPAAGAAKAAQVLRPGGVLALFWNVQQPPPDLMRASAEVYQRLMPDSIMTRWAAATGPISYTAFTEKAGEGTRQSGVFDEPELWQSEWEQRLTRDEWLDQLPTQGGHTQLPPDALAELMAGIGAAVDTLGGSFTMRYTTVAVISRATSGPRARP